MSGPATAGSVEGGWGEVTAGEVMLLALAVVLTAVVVGVMVKVMRGSAAPPRARGEEEEEDGA